MHPGYRQPNLHGRANVDRRVWMESGIRGPMLVRAGSYQADNAWLEKPADGD